MEFSPFDAREDYLRYVDGKPRYDGVQSFLESRGIALPRGKPEDAAEMETVCGLGNRKNALFLAELKEHGVEPYETTICFIRQLRARGFKTAIISSSKNCATVLEAVGATELFNARVDGVESARIGIAGKPAPGIFLEAARRLGVGPARAVVVEDAISGVEAGRAGGFGCVVGVNRGGDPARLAENGASVVVADLSELKVGTDARELPSALERLDAIAPGHDRRLAVFLDYDGTLTPIVPRPEDAVLAPEVRETVAQLARLCTVAIISGRDLANVRALVGMKDSSMPAATALTSRGRVVRSPATARAMIFCRCWRWRRGNCAMLSTAFREVRSNAKNTQSRCITETSRKTGSRCWSRRWIARCVSIPICVICRERKCMTFNRASNGTKERRCCIC